MRPDRRFGVGRTSLAAWLMLAGLASTALGQGWIAEPVDPKGHVGDVLAVAAVGQTVATAGSDGLAKVWDLTNAPKATARLAHRVDLAGHAGKVLAVALSPDGNLVATGGVDGTVRTWDAAQGTALAALKGHSGAVEALAFAPDGKTLASGSLDTTIRLWDVDARRATRAIQGHEQGIRGLAFARDGKTLASASRDHSVKLWNVADGAERKTLGRHDAPAWSVAFAPDGETVASGGLDKMIRLWMVGDPPAQPAPNGVDAGQGPDAVLTRQVRIVQGQQVVTALEEVRAQVPDNLLVPQPPPAVAGGSVSLAIQQVNDGRNPPQPNQVQIWPAGADVAAVAFTPDGHHVAAALSNLNGSRTTPGSVAFFALPRQPTPPGQPVPVPTPLATIRGHLGPIFGLAFPRTGGRVATVGGDASVRVWNFLGQAQPLAASIGQPRPGAIGERVMAHLDPVEALAISPDGQRVATASESAGVTLWDATTRTPVGRLRLPDRPAPSLSLRPDGSPATGGEPFVAVRSLAISPDGQVLATGGDGKVVSLWELESGGLIGSLKGHLGAITALAFSADGKALASGSKDASVTLWDVTRRAEIAVLARHTSAITSLAFSPDGSMLATAALDYAVKLWDLPSGHYLDSLGGHQDVVDALAFSVDGKTLASGDRTGTVRTWDVAGRAERTSIRPTSNPLRALAFAPDGKSLVGGGGDGSIRRWDLADGKVISLRAGAHTGPILTLAFGPGGRTLATGGADRELKLWDTDARLATGPFADLEGKVHQLAVASDGATLATASADGFVRIWDVTTGKERMAPIPFQAAEARVAFSPDGKLLATLPVKAQGDPAKVWDVATGKEKAKAAANEGNGTALAFAPDGMTWATNIGMAILVRDLATGSDRDAMQAHGDVRCLAFSPLGRAVVIGRADGSVERVDPMENREEKRIFRSTNNSVDVLAYSPDGRSIAIGGTDRVVRVLDAETGAVKLALRGPRQPITGLAFSPDGKLLASASDGEPTLFAWDATSGEVVSNPTLADASGHQGLACLAFAPDGKSLFAGGDRGVTTFDMSEGHRPPSQLAARGPKAGKERATLQGHAAPVRSLAFASGGSKLVTRAEDGSAKVWDLHDGNRDKHTFGGTDFKVQSMAVRPDGKTLAVGLQLPANRLKADEAPAEAEPAEKPDTPKQRISDEVKFWDIDSGEGRGMINAKATNGGSDRVVAVAYSVDGKFLATTSRPGGVVRIWDADSLEPGVDLDARSKPADLVQFSPDGKALMGADASGLVTIWDLESGKIRASFTHDRGMNQVFYSPDGRFIATAGGRVATSRPGGQPGQAASTSTSTSTGPEFGPGSGGDVRLWDPATGRRVSVLPMDSGRVTRIAFSRDGKTLAASTTGPVATIWDVDSAAPLVTLGWPSGEAKYLVFSPDGKTLAIGGEDETLRVWDVPSGTLHADLIGHADAINWVAFSPDGKTIATAGRDTAVKLWDLP